MIPWPATVMWALVETYLCSSPYSLHFASFIKGETMFHKVPVIRCSDCNFFVFETERQAMTDMIRMILTQGLWERLTRWFISNSLIGWRKRNLDCSAAGNMSLFLLLILALSSLSACQGSSFLPSDCRAAHSWCLQNCAVCFCFCFFNSSSLNQLCSFN